MRWNRRTIILAILLTSAAYALAAYMLPNNSLLIVMRSLQVTSSAALAVRFWRTAVAGWRDDFKTSASVFAFSMVLLSTGIAVSAAWLWLWRASDEPRWMVDAAINGFLVLVFYIAQTGKLLAPDVVEPHASKRAGPYIAWALVGALALSVIGLTCHDGLLWVTEQLRPLMAEPPAPNWSTKIPPPSP